MEELIEHEVAEGELTIVEDFEAQTIELLTFDNDMVGKVFDCVG